MTEKSKPKEITMLDIRKLLIGLDPITKKNLLSFAQNKSPRETYILIRHFKKTKGLDTKEGMRKYTELRSGGCKGCKKDKK